MGIRVLFAERISKETEESTSLTRQDEKLHKRLEEDSRDVALAGIAVDPNVSGEVEPENRPDLGTWLTPEGRDRWDEIWVTNQDRLSRDDMHFMAFVNHVIEWGKVLVVLDDPNLDLTTPEGRAIAHVKSIGPAKELANIKKRCADSHAHLRTTARWPGGIPPYGYDLKQTVVLDQYGKEKETKVLVLDEETTTIVHQMRNWIMEGSSCIQVAQRLNERGIPTPMDLRRARKGKASRGELWSPQAVKLILRSPSLLGYKLHRQKPIRNHDGSYFQIADAAMTQDEYDSLQDSLVKRREKPTRVSKPSPLGGVLFCGTCKGPVGHVRFNRPTGEHRYYMCRGGRHSGYKRCEGISMKADEVTELVEQEFLTQCGDLPMLKWTFHRGSDHRAELEETRKRIGRLREDRELGAYDDDPEYYAQKMREYTERKRELEQTPTEEPGWQSEELDVTYRQAWEAAEWEDRRTLLIDAGIVFWIHGKTRWELQVPENLRERMGQAA